jgi:lantibiotic modifying enzyme
MISPVVSGLDTGSIVRLFEDDLGQIAVPSSIMREDGGCAGIMFDSDAVLDRTIRQRAGMLLCFARKAASILCDNWELDKDLRFESLAGDTHNGAHRPLLFHRDKKPLVLKFSDPRPYQLLNEVLTQLSPGIGVDLRMPQIIPDPGHEWYLVPYLQKCATPLYDADQYMYSMGALTAVAYCLHMTDLHLENVIVDQSGKPVIIDPECMLCHFDSNSARRRLRNTGFLSHNVYLSSLRGGDVSQMPIFSFGLNRRSDGVLDYLRPVAGFRNRVREVSSYGLADPAGYRETVVAGFQNAFSWLAGNKDLLHDIIETLVAEDFRIRVLFRKTRQYTTIIHMLNLPCLYGARIWQEGIYHRLRSSGSFSVRPSRLAVDAEWQDMLARDVPYFWQCAGEMAIRHASGVVQNSRQDKTPKRLAQESILLLSGSNLKRLIAELHGFLDIDMTRGQGVSPTLHCSVECR